MVRLPLDVEVSAICPWYVTTAKAISGFTVTVSTSGVVQQVTPDLEIESHAPPVVVVAVAVKLKFAPVLTAVMTWGRGLAPPNGLVNASAGIWVNVWALVTLAVASIQQATNITKRMARCAFVARLSMVVSCGCRCAARRVLRLGTESSLDFGLASSRARN